MPVAHALDGFAAALAELSRPERRFVAYVLAGESYSDAARLAGFTGRIIEYGRRLPDGSRGPALRANPVAELLGRDRVSDVLKRYAPLLADPDRVRSILEPFAIAALAANLTASAAATRARAAIEITSPASRLRPSAAVPGRAGGPASAAPSSPDAFSRAREEVQKRRALLRAAEGGSAPGEKQPRPVPVEEGPRAGEADDLPDDRTVLSG